VGTRENGVPILLLGVETRSHTLWDPNDCVKTWLRSHRCASDTQIPTASKVYNRKN